MTNKLPTQIEEEFYLYATELEHQWRESLPHYSDKEWLGIFPESKKIIPKKILEWLEKKAELLEEITNKLLYIQDKVNNPETKEFLRAWIKVHDGLRLIEIEKHISSLKHLKALASDKEIKGQITPVQLQDALEVSIASLVSNQQLRRSGRNIVCLCPLHHEKTPSFYIYQEQNRWHCYGCNQGGDSINLVRLLFNYSFKEAVDYLVGGES